MQFSLVNDRSLMPMHEFHRIFDGNDVIRLGFIDSVQNRRHRGRLAGAGRAGDQHNTVLQIGNVSQLLGQVQFRESRNAFGDDPHYDGVASPLHKYVDSEATLTRQAVGNVARPLFSQRG